MKYTSVFTLTLLAAVPALAASDLTWVSHSGSDVLGCGLTANPCRTFQYAYNNVTPFSGGIIEAMDAGEYGTVNVISPVTIDGNGVGAAIEATLANSSAGVYMYPGSGLVEIRNLTIHVPASCSSCYGIRDLKGSTVIIENVLITGAPSYGVYVNSDTATIHGLTVTGATLAGIYLQGSTATISDSIVQFSPNYGIFLAGNASGVAQALIERSKIISNGVGLLVSCAGAAATARISDCVITNNATGVETSGGGQIITFRNNTWAGNATDGATPFSVSLK
jgi:Right handed beta helix region